MSSLSLQYLKTIIEVNKSLLTKHIPLQSVKCSSNAERNALVIFTEMQSCSGELCKYQTTILVNLHSVP